MINIERDIDMLYEIGSMRHIARTWTQFGGSNLANLAEHTLRVAWIALVIGKYENANLGRIVQLALIHDISEIRAGDANYLTGAYIIRDENKAAKDFSEGTTLQDEIISLWEESEKKETLESRIVKDADNLDCDLELKEREMRGDRLSAVFTIARKASYKKLYTESAREIFELIHSSDPDAWHLNANNRLKSGDWSSNKGKIK